MSRTVRFWRIGSDPELVFTRIEEWTPFIVPANQIISNNRALTTTTFIGTDGHQATAELRPSPSHNVGRHLYDIASAIDSIATYISAKPKYSNLSLMAHPVVQSEPLGGHIHTSFLYRDQLAALVMNKYNRAWTHEGLHRIDENVSEPRYGDVIMKKINEYELACSGERTMTPIVYGKVMAFLGQPLEWWVQNWFERSNRNARYGRGQDQVRYQRSTRPTFPATMDMTEWVYLHYEYRLPSTWLAHPWLAHVYLATAKLTMLNFDIIRTIVYSDKYEKIPNVGQPDKAYNGDLRTIFMKRLAQIEAVHGYRESGDIRNLRKTLMLVDQHRGDWFQPGAPVDVAAWRGLL